MNKYLILSGLSLAAAVSVLGVGKWVQASIPQAAYVTLEAVSAEDDVTCSGRVERTGSSTVTAGCSGLAASVSVQPGDKVHKGQTLAEIAALPEGTSQAEAVETYSALLAGGEPEELGLLETLETRTLSSPIDGTVTAVSIGENEAVRSGQTAVVISNGDGLQLSLSVNESQIAALRLGQRAEITPDAGLTLGRANSIAVGERSLATSVPGIFAAGDAVYGTKSVIQAIASGKDAAAEIDRFLGGDGDLKEVLAPVEPASPRLGWMEHFSRLERKEPQVKGAEEREHNFELFDFGICDGDICGEASRCLQ